MSLQKGHKYNSTQLSNTSIVHKLIWHVSQVPIHWLMGKELTLCPMQFKFNPIW